MMKPLFRAVGIVFLKWVVVFLIIGFLYGALPKIMGDLGPTIFTWIVAFILSFLAAIFLFSNTAPSKKQLTMAVAVWVLVTLTCQLAYGLGLSSLGLRSITSLQTIGQLIAEVVALLLASATLRRRSLKNELGEGAV